MPRNPQDRTDRIKDLPPGLKLRQTLTGHHGVVHRLVWAPNGTYLASASADGNVRMWTASDGKPMGILGGNSRQLFCVAVSPRDPFIAAAGADSHVRIWRVGDGALVHTLKGHSAAIWGLAFSPDGELIASASDDGSVRVWQSLDGGFIRSLHGHTHQVWGVAFSKDGSLILSASADRTIRMWRTQDGQLLDTLVGHVQPVLTVSFSPDGSLFASSSADGTVRIWNTETHCLETILDSHAEAVDIAAFSQDGRVLASKSYDDTVRLWRCDTWDLMAVLFEPMRARWRPALDFHPKTPSLATLAHPETDIRLWDLDIDLLLASTHTRVSRHHKSRPPVSQQRKAQDRGAPWIVEEKRAEGRFDVFLCHNSEDKTAVRGIAQRLVEHGVLPWLDEWELRPGLPWQRALEERIEKIQAAAVFVGENATGPWQDLEIEAYIRQFVRRGCPVIPVILPDATHTPSLPVFLRGMAWVDFRKDDPDPLHRLIWGITGKHPRELAR